MPSPEQTPVNQGESSIEKIEVGDILEDIYFKQTKGKRGEAICKSSVPGRKLIELNVPYLGLTDPENACRVRIVQDTNPGDPLSGKFIAQLVPFENDLDPEEWQKVEGKVAEAEIEGRKARALLDTDNNEWESPVPDLSSKEAKVLEKLGIPEQLGSIDGVTAADFIAHEEAYRELLGEEGSPEHALVSLRFKNLVRAMKSDRALENERERMLAYEAEALKRLRDKKESGKPASTELAALKAVRAREEKIEKAEEELKQSTPEAWYGLNLKELKGYKEELESGKIVETEYVKKQAEDIATHIRAGQPVFVHGHLGTGKTELAFHVAREYFGKEALIISGSKHTSQSELYGHQILSLREVDEKESDDKYQAYLKTAEKELSNWKGNHPGAKEEEVSRQFELIKSGLQERLAYEYRSGTVSDYFMGQVYQAMEEGRPVIIDEVNAIPHEVLISLNHLLTRKPGDKVRIQQNSGSAITVKEGFGFILTGNINEGAGEQYVMRQDIDPAFLSRLYSMKHDYLPQVRAGILSEAHLGDGKGARNEFFELMFARMMDRNGNMEMPEDSMRKLWNLAKAARVTQDNFGGGSVDASMFFNQGRGTRPFEYRLKEGVLSIRAMEKILNAWQSDGYKNELDYYVFREFVNQPTKLADKAYLYQLFKDQYDFFRGTGWEQDPDYGSQGVVSKFEVHPPEIKSGKLDFKGPREVVDIVYGKEGPKRKDWPEYRSKGKKLKKTAETAETDPALEIARKIADYEIYSEGEKARLQVVLEDLEEDLEKRQVTMSDGETRELKNIIDQVGQKLAELKIAVEQGAKTGDFTEAEKVKEEIGRIHVAEGQKEFAVSLVEARDILGSRMFGPEEVENAFGIKIENVPEIPFSREMLEKAVIQGLDLILYADKLPDGNPITGTFLYKYLQGKKKDGTKLLYDTDWYKNEAFFTSEAPELSWRLSSREVIPNSTSKNYLLQTIEIGKYVKSLYGDKEIPEEVQEALDELTALINNDPDFENKVKSADGAVWKLAAEKLAGLKINNLFRETFVEFFYRLSLIDKAKAEQLFGNIYSWTKSRSSDGGLVSSGHFVRVGLDVGGSEPRGSASVIGCSFSAEKL